VKQLLAISWEMPPLSGPRAVQVTRTLVGLGARGWQSRVVCFDARSNRYHQDYRVSVEEMSRGTARRMPVPSPEEWLFFRSLWRVLPPLKHQPDEKIVWLPSALAEARRALHEQAADAIVSFAQPWTDHLIALKLHRETGLPWVAHFSDPWVDSPYQPASGWFAKRRRSMEAAVVGAADATIFVNVFTRDRVMQKYPAEWKRRAHVIPQGFVPGASPAPLPPAGPMRLAYTGRFYHGIRTPTALFDALALVRQRRQLAGALEIEFVGADMEPYDRDARRRGLDAIVRFAGRLNPDDARDRAGRAHVLLTIDAASDGPSLFLPSKLIDYLPLGRPILGITPREGAAADLLRRLDYPVADPHDAAGIAVELERLLDRHRDGRLAASRAHHDVAAEYHIDATSAAFDRVLATVTGRA
jgi:hypothetical protein